MVIEDLASRLRESFYPPATTGIDAVFRLQVGDEHIDLAVREGTLAFGVPGDTPRDATFIFSDLETARALLCGEANAFEAFMEGRFRSDGYLMWAFALMAMFRSASLPVTPTE